MSDPESIPYHSWGVEDAMPHSAIPLASVAAERYSTRPGPSWGGALIVSCLVLGALASWIVAERRQRLVEHERATAMRTAAVRDEGEAEDLGKLISDPRTRLIHLMCSPMSSIHQASLAWNDALQQGALFCDQLPLVDTGMRYIVTVTSDNDVSHPISQIQARPGTSVYPFKPSNPANRVTHFEIHSPGGAEKEPVLWGDVR